MQIATSITNEVLQKQASNMVKAMFAKAKFNMKGPAKGSPALKPPQMPSAAGIKI